MTALDYRLDPPDDEPTCDCSECEGTMEIDTHTDEWVCNDDACGHTEALPEDPRIADYEAYRVGY